MEFQSVFFTSFVRPKWNSDCKTNAQRGSRKIGGNSEAYDVVLHRFVGHEESAARGQRKRSTVKQISQQCQRSGLSKRDAMSASVTTTRLGNAAQKSFLNTIVSFLTRFFQWFPASRQKCVLAFAIDGKSVYCIGRSLSGHADAIFRPS
jgi:hypothetical protein